MQKLTLGIDVACRAAHQGTLADDSGKLHLERPEVPNDPRGTRSPVANASLRCRDHRGDGADPQCLGPPHLVVPTAGGQSHLGPARAVGGLTGLLRQAHQVRPIGLLDPGPAPALAPRRTASSGGLRTG